MEMNNGQPRPTTNHFSHPHTLNLINYQSTHSIYNNRALTLCSCCNQTLSSNSWVYGCTPCGYFLHLSCSNMPPKITHPSCPSSAGRHVLRLHPKPDTATHPSGAFNCAACLKDDDCFSYRCDPCGTNLHTACASSPLSLRHHSHPHHDLHLAFSLPYPNQPFSCGTCGHVGIRGWLYRCSSCPFDLHFECAKASHTPAPAPAPAPPPPATSQADMNQRFSEYVMRNHPQMLGAAPLGPPYNNLNANISYGFPTYNNNLNNLVTLQLAAQEQARIAAFAAAIDAANNMDNQGFSGTGSDFGAMTGGSIYDFNMGTMYEPNDFSNIK